MSVSASGNGEIKFYDIHGEDMAYYETTYTNAKVSGEGIEETNIATTVNGYYDGKMYISYKDNKVDQKLWAPSSADQYREYLESKEDDNTDFKVEYFSNKEAERDEDDGSWTTTMSGASEEGLKNMKKMVGGVADIFESTFYLKDVEVTIEYDKKYYPQYIEANYIFAVISGKTASSVPTLCIEIEYDDYGETEVDEPDLGSYTETKDLTVIDKVADAFEAREEYNERVNFTAGLLTRVSDADNGTSYSRASYKYTGSAYYEGNKFKYNVKMQNGDVSNPSTKDITVYSYSNGKQSVMQEGSTVGTATICTDLEAKAFMSDFVNYPDFSSGKIQSIAQKSDGVYEFTFFPSAADELKEAITETGAKVTSTSAVLTVTMNGDSIKSYVYTVTLNYTDSGYKLKLVQTMDVQFN